MVGNTANCLSQFASHNPNEIDLKKELNLNKGTDKRVNSRPPSVLALVGPVTGFLRKLCESFASHYVHIIRCKT